MAGPRAFKKPRRVGEKASDLVKLGPGDMRIGVCVVIGALGCRGRVSEAARKPGVLVSEWRGTLNSQVNEDGEEKPLEKHRLKVWGSGLERRASATTGINI